MTTGLLALIGVALVYNAVITTLRWSALRARQDRHAPVNEIPQSIQPLSEGERAIVNLHLEEWKIIIQTQMHFNDLIIRFRSIVLTAFITLVGASVALQKAEQLDEKHILELLILLCVLWLTAFVLDFFYYHRLLLGSVAQAMKFDRSELGKKLGLFGLTTCISNVVHPPTSKIMVALFYGIPAISVFVLIAAIFCSWI